MERSPARLVIHLWNGDDRVVDLPEGHTEVGRASDAGIRLTLPQVSSHHAEMHWDGTRLRIRDLSSTNGTEVNGRSVVGWTALHDGDRVNWGPVEADVVLTLPEQPAVSGALPDNGLRRQGWDAWLDESSIPGGASWGASIQQALRSSSVVVLLVTADSVSKEWVLDEIAAARNLRVPIIPAVLEHVRLPDELHSCCNARSSLTLRASHPLFRTISVNETLPHPDSTAPSSTCWSARADSILTGRECGSAASFR